MKTSVSKKKNNTTVKGVPQKTVLIIIIHVHSIIDSKRVRKFLDTCHTVMVVCSNIKVRTLSVLIFVSENS